MEQSRIVRLDLRAVRARAARAEGFALVVALAFLTVLSLAAVGAWGAATSNERSFDRDRQVTRALAIGEAGLNNAIATLTAIQTPQSSLAPASGTLDGGSWSYTAARAQDDPAGHPDEYTWTIVATGVAPDHTTTRIVSTRVKETVTQTTQEQTATSTTPPSAVYGYGVFLGDPASDCATSGSGNLFSASAQVTVPIYVAGSLCISGGGSPIVAEPAGSSGTVTFYVGKIFKTQSNASPVGTSSAHLASATVVGGCVGDRGPVSCSKQGVPMDWTGSPTYGSGVWANVYSSTQNPIAKPAVDPVWYAESRPGPLHACNSNPLDGTQTSSPGPLVFDTNGLRDMSLTGANGSKDILQLVNNWNSAQNSYDCRFYDSNGNLVGRLAWTFPQNCSGAGTMVIQGTVYFDGNLTFASCDYAIYTGVGTMYVNGTVSFANGAKLCAAPIAGSPCVGNYDPSRNMLELVAVNAAGRSPGFTMSGAGVFEGTAWANGVFNTGNGAKLAGPVIADTATMSGAATVRKTIVPPSGAPGAAVTTTTTTTTEGPPQSSWSTIAGSWQQLR